VAAGRTVLFATHRLEEAGAVADRVLVLARGRLLADGPPDQVSALAAGPGAASLEEAFLQLTSQADPA
jgi:ABC-type multidrug transport system ATPase subunit